jgi:hypothetical protein
MFLITIAILGVIAISWAINYFLKKVSKNNVFELPSWGKNLLSGVISFIIWFINLCLLLLIKKLTEYERHRTYTAYNFSVAFKLTLAQFLNTAIIPVIINI